MRTLFIFTLLYSSIALSNDFPISKWKACEDSWFKAGPPELYEVFRHEDFILMRTNRSEVVQGKSESAPSFYLMDGKEAYVIDYPVEGNVYFKLKNFNFDFGGTHYCMSYECTSWPFIDKVVNFKEVLSAPSCNPGHTLKPRKLTTPEDFKALSRAIEKRIINNIGDAHYALSHGKGDPDYTAHAYKHSQKWNTEVCKGLSPTLDSIIKDRPKNLAAHMKRMTSNSSPQKTLPSNRQDGAN